MEEEQKQEQEQPKVQQPAQQVQPTAPLLKEETHGKAVTALVLGILSLSVSALSNPIPLILAIIGLVFACGIRGKDKSIECKAGFVTSLIGVILNSVVIIVEILACNVIKEVWEELPYYF
jgi:hypothetical protein